MKNISSVLVNAIYLAIKKVALVCVLACCSMLPSVHAQTMLGSVRSTAEARNLQVQAGPVTRVHSDQRVALVIGNAAYKDAPLINPVNDARAITQALQESGFNVITRENTDQRAMLSALREFGERLRAGGTGLFYYAGHGMQIKGRNYLIPVGANIEREDEVAYNAVDAQAVLDKMEAAGNVANIMILDACRNNPFTRNARSAQAGLAQMDAPVGTLVAYATSPGAVASDGSGIHGLYTQHLLAAIRQPSSKVEDVFKQVRANVRRDSLGKQVPWEATSLEGDFYFRGGPSAGSGGGGSLEAALWDAVKGSKLTLEIQVYLNRYPAGQFSSQARARLTQLQAAAEIALAVPVLGPSSAPPLVINGRASTQVRYTEGDSWTFTTTDLLTQKQSRSTHKVSSVTADGDGIMNDGALIYTSAATIKYLRNSDRERFYSDNYSLIPTQLHPGFKENVRYEIVTKFKDGREARYRAEGSMEAVGREKIVTPAGEFLAWRIHRLVNASTQAGEQVKRDDTFWFVPEIKRVVAQDNSETNVKSDQISARERVVLQTFTLADSHAQAAVAQNKAQAASQPGGGVVVGDSAAAPDDQAAVDKRTAELLASISAAQHAPASLKVPEPGVNASTASARNSAGFTVGDLWRYQRVDKFKQEVTDNWARRVDGFNGDGSIRLNGGAVDWTPDGALKTVRDSGGVLTEFSPAYRWLPQTLKTGYSEVVKHALVWRKSDGRNGTEEREGTVKVLSQEKIKVPAGEFIAWKIELMGWANGKDLGNNSSYINRFKETWWYVPDLRNFVASEYEQRNQNNQIQYNERHELTSFSVRGAEKLAQH